MTATVKEFIAATRGSFLSGDPHFPITHVSIDSRQIKAGDTFFAIRGPRHDGHDHLEEVVRRGASTLVVQRIPEPSDWDTERLPSIIQVPETLQALQDWARWKRAHASATVIGITGSNGKTTSKEMLSAILKRTGPVLSTRGNLNNHIGLPLMLMELSPDHRFAVLEMGASIEGDIALLAGIAKPQVGIITNIGKAHLEGLQSPEGIFNVKRALLDALPAEGTAIINIDDPLLAPLAATLSCRKVTFGVQKAADIRATDIRPEPSSVHFRLHCLQHTRDIRLALPGHFQVLNALAAAAAAYALGVSLHDIVEGLEHFTPVAMRMQVLNHPSGALFINDAYNANPTSMQASIESFCQSHPDRQKWVVLGDMRELGAQAAAEHRQLGLWLSSQPLEQIWLYGRDMRFTLESLQTAQGPTAQRFRQKRLLCQALRQALKTSNPKKAVLFKASRRMKLEQVIQNLLESN